MGRGGHGAGVELSAGRRQETSTAPRCCSHECSRDGNGWFRIPTILYGALIAWSDGYVNANTKSRFDTYGGMMTGNTVSLGRAVALEKWEDVGVFASLLALFFCGACVGWFLEPWHKIGSFRILGPFVLIVFGTLEAVSSYAVDDPVVNPPASGYPENQKWVSVIAALAMGCVDVVGFKGFLKQHVTFMTGNLQKLSGFTWQLVTGKRERDPSKPNSMRVSQAHFARLHHDAQIIGAIWCSYVLGAICGAEAADRGFYDGKPDWTLMVPAAVIATVSLINEGPDEVSQEEERASAPIFELLHACCDDECHLEKNTVTLQELEVLYDRLGAVLSAERAESFLKADINDDGYLDVKEFATWVAGGKQ